MSIGGNACYASAAASATLNVTGGLTMESWFNVADNGNFQTLVTQTNGTRQYAFYIAPSSPVGREIYFCRGGGCIGVGIYPGWTPGAWNHIAVTSAGLNSAAMLIYINGALAYSGIFAGGSSQTSSTTYFGYDQPAGNYPLNGVVDEVHISSTVRSAGWISTEFQNQSAPGNIGSAGFWTFGSWTPVTGGSGSGYQIVM
jgi:hypothetical protein